MTSNVFHDSLDIAEVGPGWYEKLKRHALEAKMKRARLCLHHTDDDPLHEMLIVFHRDAVTRPHRHRNKTESYHMIFGELDIVLFDDNGKPVRLIHMGDLASGKTHIYRMNRPIWHSVIIRSEFAAIHEVTNGPFRVEENEFAPWAPEQPEQIRTFLENSVKGLLGYSAVFHAGAAVP